MQTEKQLWIEMSIKEIWTQAHFAEVAFTNLTMKGRSSSDVAFSSIHSFLSHCAMVSKMLKSTDQNLVLRERVKNFIRSFLRLKIDRPVAIGEILRIPKSSVIHRRTFRNHLEHYDERLKKWIKEKGVDVSIGTYNIGPKDTFRGITFISHWDPSTYTYTFVDDDTDLLALKNEVSKIKTAADTWVKSSI